MPAASFSRFQKLAELGWFEVQIAEEAGVEEAQCAANSLANGETHGAARI